MLNMNFNEQVVIDTLDQDWVQSPLAGVWRKPLAREEAERGHATSIVKYEAGASFKHHNHPLGEEIFVLNGVFSDETGDYPAGTYFRNPEGFSHAPFSKNGCLLLVKLHQFFERDLVHICIDSYAKTWQTTSAGMSVLHLHEHSYEHLHDKRTENVFLKRLATGETLNSLTVEAGEEIYIISGELADANGEYAAGTWIRSPRGSVWQVKNEALIWQKTGHLNVGTIDCNADPELLLESSKECEIISR